jgi:hypothetical protein
VLFLSSLFESELSSHGVESEGVVMRRKSNGDTQPVVEPSVVRTGACGDGASSLCRTAVYYGVT